MQNGLAITWGNNGIGQSFLTMFIKIYLVLTSKHQTANDNTTASGTFFQPLIEGCNVDVTSNIMNTEWSRAFQSIKLLNDAVLAVINNRLQIHAESQDAHWFSKIEN